MPSGVKVPRRGVVNSGVKRERLPFPLTISLPCSPLPPHDQSTLTKNCRQNPICLLHLPPAPINAPCRNTTPPSTRAPPAATSTTCQGANPPNNLLPPSNKDCYERSYPCSCPYFHINKGVMNHYYRGNRGIVFLGEMKKITEKYLMQNYLMFNIEI